MLAVKRIRLVGEHRDQVLERILRRAGRAEIGHLSRSELRRTAELIVTHLPQWMASPREAVDERFRAIGSRVFLDGVPLDGEIRALQLIRDDILGYVRDQAAPLNAVEVYAQEEFGLQLMHLFDVMTVSVVRGHEQALREQLEAAA
jgi:hypothetical protein